MEHGALRIQAVYFGSSLAIASTIQLSNHVDHFDVVAFRTEGPWSFRRVGQKSAVEPAAERDEVRLPCRFRLFRLLHFCGSSTA